jgi:hypothetical protein
VRSGLCGFVEQSCCASAARSGSSGRPPRRAIGTTFISPMVVPMDLARRRLKPPGPPERLSRDM